MSIVDKVDQKFDDKLAKKIFKLLASYAYDVDQIRKSEKKKIIK